MYSVDILDKNSVVKVRKNYDGSVRIDIGVKGNVTEDFHLMLCIDRKVVEANMGAFDTLRSYLETLRQDIELTSVSVDKQ